jgi:hypothetical protein
MLRGSKAKLQTARIAVIGAVTMAVLMLSYSYGRAATLDDYQKRIAGSREDLGRLQELDATAGEASAAEQKLLQAIRNAVPPKEKVEWPGGSIETDNTWFHSGLDAFDAEVNKSKRAVILDQLDERLEAIGNKIDEFYAATAGTRSKDEDKRKLAEILSREEYQKPAEKDESLFQKWRRALIEWLLKMFPQVNIQPQESTGLGSLSVVLQVLLYVLLAVGLGYLVYRFLPFFSDRFGRRTKRANNERVILGERIGDHESSSDLFADAERLARDGELRLAIRKGYIALLCELSDRKIIGLARHKTNRDYLRDLRSRRDLLENVRGLTGRFERHWYGGQDSDERSWEEFRSLYRETVRGV